MTAATTPYDALERVFHEPRRMAIMAALLSEADGMTFNQLKDGLRLTDGNLSRHLKALREADAITLDKAFVDNKPRTTARLTATGRSRFMEYLDALEAVLKDAAARLEGQEQTATVRGSTVRPKLAPT